MKNKEFDNLFEELVVNLKEIEENSRKEAYEKLTKSINRIVKYVKKRESTNQEVNPTYHNSVNKHDAFDEFSITYVEGIEYGVSAINEKKELQKKGIDISKYEDVYSIYIINDTIKKMRKYLELKRIKNYEFDEDTYYNALLSVLDKLRLKYNGEKPLEGKSNNYSKRLIYDIFTNDSKKKSLNNFAKVIEKEDILLKSNKHEKGIYSLSQIPFIKANNDFINIVDYCNENVLKLPYKEKQQLFKEYPQLCLSLDQQGSKKPEVMMKEYLCNEINLNNRIGFFEELDKKSLRSIYIYLLVPHLTPEVCNRVCKTIREDIVDKFLTDMKETIVEKKRIYQKNAVEGIKILKKIGTEEDTDYITDKIIACLDFLTNCERIIDECIIREKEDICGPKKMANSRKILN